MLDVFSISIYPSPLRVPQIPQVGSELLQRCCARRLEAPRALRKFHRVNLGPVGRAILKAILKRYMLKNLNPINDTFFVGRYSSTMEHLGFTFQEWNVVPRNETFQSIYGRGCDSSAIFSLSRNFRPLFRCYLQIGYVSPRSM